MVNSKKQIFLVYLLEKCYLMSRVHLWKVRADSCSYLLNMSQYCSCFSSGSVCLIFILVYRRFVRLLSWVTQLCGLCQTSNCTATANIFNVSVTEINSLFLWRCGRQICSHVVSYFSFFSWQQNIGTFGSSFLWY